MNPTLSPAEQRAANLRQSLQLGAVQTPPGAADAGGPPKVLSYATVVVPVGGKFPVNVPGDYVYVETITGYTVTYSPITLLPDTANIGIPVTATQKGFVFPTPFNRIQIENPVANGAAVTVTIYIGFGRYQNDTPSGFVALGSPIWKTGEFGRPNNVIAYAANQAVSTNPASQMSLAAFARTPGGRVNITKARLFKNSTTVTNAQFRAYLFDEALAPAAVADQVAFTLNYADRDGYLGFVDFTDFVVGGAGNAAISYIDGLLIPAALTGSSTAIKAQLVALAAYVPIANEEFSLGLFGDQY